MCETFWIRLARRIGCGTKRHHHSVERMLNWGSWANCAGEFGLNDRQMKRRKRRRRRKILFYSYIAVFGRAPHFHCDLFIFFKLNQKKNVKTISHRLVQTFRFNSVGRLIQIRSLKSVSINTGNKKKQIERNTALTKDPDKILNFSFFWPQIWRVSTFFVCAIFTYLAIHHFDNGFFLLLLLPRIHSSKLWTKHSSTIFHLFPFRI